MAVADRNNMWLTAGHELNGTLLWMQPELILYDRRRDHGHGYPDVINDGGLIFVTETFKSSPGSEAKTHAVEPKLISLLLAQRDIKAVASEGLVSTKPGGGVTRWQLKPDTLPDFSSYPRPRYGITVDLWLASATGTAGSADDGAPLLELGEGAIVIKLSANGTASVAMHPNVTSTAPTEWVTDPVCSARLASPGKHHLALTIDGGPKMIMWLVDGHLCDGGPQGYAYDKAAAPPPTVEAGGAAGWLLFDPYLGALRGDGSGGGSAKAGTRVASVRV
jgi:hypothetical protein